jgi:hypothetical protein
LFTVLIELEFDNLDLYAQQRKNVNQRHAMKRNKSWHKLRQRTCHIGLLHTLLGRCITVICRISNKRWSFLTSLLSLLYTFFVYTKTGTKEQTRNKRTNTDHNHTLDGWNPMLTVAPLAFSRCNRSMWITHFFL